MVEFNVVDLVLCLCLESFIDKVVLPVSDPQLHGIKDGAEPAVGYESTIAFVLVLEEWLDEQSPMVHVDSDSLQALLQLFFLRLGEGVLRVQNRRSVVGRKSNLRVLLKSFYRENLLDLIIEVRVPDLYWVDRAPERLLQQVVLLLRQLYLLGVESSSEFGRLDRSFAKWVVILEEFSQPDPVSLHVVLNLCQKVLELFRTFEISE